MKLSGVLCCCYMDVDKQQMTYINSERYSFTEGDINICYCENSDFQRSMFFFQITTWMKLYVSIHLIVTKLTVVTNLWYKKTQTVFQRLLFQAKFSIKVTTPLKFLSCYYGCYPYFSLNNGLSCANIGQFWKTCSTKNHPYLVWDPVYSLSLWSIFMILTNNLRYTHSQLFVSNRCTNFDEIRFIYESNLKITACCVNTILMILRHK